MMWTKQICVLALLGVAISAVAAQAPKWPTKYVLIVFGDSLSDTGNNFRAAGVPDPRIYYKGRYSNGPNWVDYLKHAVKPVQIFNYAYGGATACYDPMLEKAYPFIKNLTGQVAEFIADVKSGKVPTGKYVKLIVIQFIGANDIQFPLRRALTQGSLPTLAQLGAAVQALVTCRVAGIQALFSVPAVKHIAVIPVPPMYTTPVVPVAFKPQLKALEQAATEATVAVLGKLQMVLSVAPPGYPGAGVKLYSLGTTAEWMTVGYEKVQPSFVFTNASCTNANSAMASVTADLKICEDPDDYLWFDATHPTTRYHEWFATQGLLPQLRQLKLIPSSF